MEDIQIIELYFARKESAIAETDTKYGRYCLTVANNILHNAEDSEECKNDTYMKTWSVIPPKKPDNFRAFLGKIARNLALDMYEKLHRKKRDINSTEAILDELAECIPDPNSDVEKISEDGELRDVINAFLGTLSEDNRKIFVRRYWYAGSVEDIAADYSFGKSKVKMSLSRTREKLKEYLESEGIAL
ncbi:MAG: sigma-70 family RNA polymerase sigma factor [Ruminiclostridium sp.]|nr:sigma-70 family RNA polymerase sigma factor [Ruminiclostridium sp.]